MDYIKIITESGSVGVAIYAIYTLRQITSNHISHATDQSKKLELAIQRLTDCLEHQFKKKK